MFGFHSQHLTLGVQGRDLLLVSFYLQGQFLSQWHITLLFHRGWSKYLRPGLSSHRWGVKKGLMQRVAPASWAEKFPLSVCLQKKKCHRRAIAQSEAFWACSQSERGERRPTSQDFSQRRTWLAQSSANWSEWEGSRERKNTPSPKPANSPSYTHTKNWITGNELSVRGYPPPPVYIFSFLPLTSSLSTNLEAVLLTNKGTGHERETERGGRGFTLQIFCLTVIHLQTHRQASLW